ncbi:MAG: TIGR03905 family TSCPD domain-containing protein [Clostridia bacterium]|nr:TIGR03905 family TSCPD domain-containing protein [Clostridia bacterium]
MKYNYVPSGVCSRNIEIDVENGIIQNVKYTGGCNGNTQGIGALTKGMKVEEAIKRLKGIDCNGRGTSCPDQLAIALEKILSKEMSN